MSTHYTKYVQYDITNHNMNPSDNVRADMFGWVWSPNGWPGGQDENSSGRISQASSKEDFTKVRRGSGCLYCQTLVNSLLIHNPTDHQGTRQTFSPQTGMSCWVYRGQMSSSPPLIPSPVTQQGSFWDHGLFPTFRLAVVWTLVNHFVWIVVKLI